MLKFILAGIEAQLRLKSPFHSTAANAHIRSTKDSKKHSCTHIAQHFTARLVPNYSSILTAASLSEGAATEEAEARKHRANDPMGQVFRAGLGVYPSCLRNLGREAHSTFSRLASHLAITTSSLKGKVLTELYSRLNFTLVRAMARALLARCAPSLGLLDIP